jgi:hypothetical protein
MTRSSLARQVAALVAATRADAHVAADVTSPSATRKIRRYRSQYYR